jgi:FtsH-binding integral membrane protein
MPAISRSRVVPAPGLRSTIGVAIGGVIASTVNVLVASSTLQPLLSVAGVVALTGLTAFDTQ